MTTHNLRCGDFVLDLTSPKIMAIVNTTPDSFSDGGSYHNDHGYLQLSSVLTQVEAMLEDGADIIDVGGESTRPGADAVSLDEELARVVPVVHAIRKEFDVLISVDTSRPEVMTQAAAAGAGIINDVRALTLPGAVQAAAQSQLPVCLMHMLGSPKTMQDAPEYEDIVADVYDYLSGQLAQAESAGIPRQRVILDPGFGFGKTPDHNLALINQLYRLLDLHCPLLVGVSRKSTVGAILTKPVDQRVFGSLILAHEALRQGAKIIRVHDVGPTADLVKMYNALENNRRQGLQSLPLHCG